MQRFDSGSIVAREIDLPLLPMQASILVIDDDRELCAMLAEYLSADGFVVSQAHDGAAGVQALRDHDHSLVVMDISMPVMDGFDALREIRGFSEVPVLMLTARGDELDRIVGLELGADDYLPKPFNPRELTARLRAILRRSQPLADDQSDCTVGDLRLEPRSLSLYRGDQPLNVTATEYAVMEYLMRAAGRIIDKNDLSQRALGRALTPYDRSLDTHISNLRRKLGPLPNGEARIKTVRGRGYQLLIPADQA